MQLIVGLGNPGPKHAGNRHNIGFMAVDAIVRRHGFSSWRKQLQGATAESIIGGEKVLVVKPMTYMNESGRSVGEALRFFNLEPTQLTVFHDEIDLAPGKVRVKLGGGHAGNNGLRSISAHIGPHYRRVRLGVGHPGDKNLVMPHVLSDFSKDERAWLATLLDAVADAVPLLIAGEEGSFQNRVHLAVNPEEKPQARERKVEEA
jgi:peptidyl-tRNA hydrolase, PTH1 family